MKLSNLVENTKYPNTVKSLVEDFKNLGLTSGMTVIVHSSLSSIGWVNGGEQAIILALMEVITEDGTIIMPTHSGDLSDPSKWENPPVPEAWWQIIRDTMPAFNIKTTPSFGMGKIVECFRNFDDVKRSFHPEVSFAAWGKHSDLIISNHSINFPLGDKSPLQKIYDLNGLVLLLGVGYDSNTSLHLAEFYSDTRNKVKSSAPIIENGVRVWKEYEDFDFDDSEFEKLGEEFEKTHSIFVGKVGNAITKLMNQKELVDFAASFLKKT